MLRAPLLLEEVEQERRRKQRVENKQVGRRQEVLHLLVKLAKYLRIFKHKLMASRHWRSLLRHSLSLPQEVWMAVSPSSIQHTDSQFDVILRKHMKNTPW
jgi:biotin-(acetyl-CoA carboxylase) ligase